MTIEFKRELEDCLDDLTRGRLTPQRLRAVIDRLPEEEGRTKRQDLLYIQARNTSILSEIQGFSLVVDGKLVPTETDPEQWPYNTVADAMRDGWRVISFPELSLMVDDTRTYGLGCQFVLEKWG